MDVQAMAEAAWNEEETAIVERGRLLKRLVLAKHVEIATLDKLIEQELWEQRALKRILNPQGHEPGHGGHPRSDLATSDLDVTSPETGFTAHDSDMNGMGRFTGNGDDDPTPLMRGATDSMGSPVGYIRQGSSSANVGEQRGSRTRMPGMRHSAGVGRFDDGEDGGGYDDGDEEEYDDDISDGGKDDDEIEFDEY